MFQLIISIDNTLEIPRRYFASRDNIEMHSHIDSLESYVYSSVLLKQTKITKYF